MFTPPATSWQVSRPQPPRDKGLADGLYGAGSASGELRRVSLFRRRRPPPALAPVTAGLIGLNCLVFLYELQTGGLGVLAGGGSFDVNVLFYKWGFIPSELSEGRDYRFLFDGTDIASPVPTWATLFSCMFIHGGFLHLAGNMLFLWVFGNSMENHLGPLRFSLLYLATGMAAALSHLAIDPHSQVPLIGASGAVSGVLGLIF